MKFRTRALAASAAIALAAALAACEAPEQPAPAPTPDPAPETDMAPEPMPEPEPAPEMEATPQDMFFANLGAMCGQAYEGEIVANVGGPEGADPFEGHSLVMHVRECSDTEIRVPFHVGEDRSRTWVFTRTDDGLRLKHDHRHEDGSDDVLTMYGGDTADMGTATEQHFPADQFSKDLFEAQDIPVSMTNVWIVRLVPGEVYSYSLTRPGREFTVDFDLTNVVDAPPPPWGDE